ncbi:30S ribosome-binding factor RbfA [Filifactor villosus]|uniref:Ribosome-binding factor A n=1 Tax=Filifactor villosus TaxID=29374 RepID=A0ABV9QJK7_9FIRM
MAYDRTRRISEEIKKVVSSMLLEGEIKDTKIRQSKGLISVTNVDVVRDLKYAYVYISVLGDDPAEIIEGLKRASGYVRNRVGRVVDLRYTPEIIFRPDDSIQKGVEMSKLINELGIDHSEDEKEEE